MSLHPALEPVRLLIGTWSGAGRGEYPTLDDFEYTEEITFTDVGKPFLAYAQRTWAPDGRPLHVETGYLRVPTQDTAEFVLAQPTGQTELAEGTLTAEPEGFRIELHSQVINSRTAKTVEATTRTLHLAGDRLTTTFDMEAVGVQMTRHLTSELSRT